jgi:hypothetical protein
MTDLSPTTDATVPCLRCAAQNDGRQSTCQECGAPLVATGSEGERGDLELEEVWRSAAAGGYDADFEQQGSDAVCPACGARFTPAPSAISSAVGVRDTASARGDLLVATLRCPQCHTPGRLLTDAEALESVNVDTSTPADGELVASETGTAEVRTAEENAARDEVSWRHPQPPGSSAERPLGEDRRHFEEPAGRTGGNLADQQELIDEEGDDIREYTGEPVETEEGWVLPQQQNAGPGNVAGGGEWPDPRTPSAQPGTADEQRH